MRKILLLFILVFCYSVSHAQKLKGEPENEGNLYSNVVDTLVSFVIGQDGNNAIVVSADQFILRRIPDSFSGIEISKTSKYKVQKKFDQFVWIRINKFVLDMDRLFVFAKIKEQKDDLLQNWKYEPSNCKLTYRCDQKQGTYELIDFQAVKSQQE
ncbi:hypothetical protein [Mangrovibacterium lignilyticum]|uniref:hypothetical protein n=1 Tax=Mangrovibacterium lignilyticum TaxID=2668052 RepID=UPI0013D1DD06|nr:hypothetical protein [Mangrovibacterium lignilyticum]